MKKINITTISEDQLELIKKQLEQTRIDNENYIKVLTNYFDEVKENKLLKKTIDKIIEEKKQIDKKYNELLDYSNRIYTKLIRLENESK